MISAGTHCPTVNANCLQEQFIHIPDVTEMLMVNQWQTKYGQIYFNISHLLVKNKDTEERF